MQGAQVQSLIRELSPHTATKVEHLVCWRPGTAKQILKKKKRTTEWCTPIKWGGNQEKNPIVQETGKPTQGWREENLQVILRTDAGISWNQRWQSDQTGRKKIPNWYVKSSPYHAFCHCPTTLNSRTITGYVPLKQKSKTIRKKYRGYRKTRTPTRRMRKIIPRTTAKSQDNSYTATWRVTSLGRGEKTITRNDVSREKSLEWVD